MFGFDPETLLVKVIAFLVAIPVHEWAHCYVAYMLGDDTPALQGRLTLNPLVHLDPIGSLLILVGGFGWGRPALVNPYRMHKVRKVRTGMMLTALAGPYSNLVLALLAALPLRLGLVNWLESPASPLANFLLTFITLNLGLMVFNLLPIPPLDGSKVLAGLLPEPLARFIESLEAYGFYILVLVLFVLPAIGLNVFGTIAGILTDIFSILFLLPL